MLFNSLEYALFLPFVLLVYFRLRRRQQNLFLLVASYFFYAYWDWHEALYRQYGERLASFSRRESIRYLDVVGDDVRRWSDDRMFNDAGHLTAPAARHFTTLVADAWLARTP